MPYGVVLLPDRETHDRLAALAAVIGGPAAVNVLGDHAPAHVSVAHFEADARQASVIERHSARHSVRDLRLRIIGLLYASVAPGDYYFPGGGVYFGIEIVRRPDLDALHREVLGWVDEVGGAPLGQVGADFRPHVTLGIGPDASLPAWPSVPVGEFPVTLAFAELGPYGTFPDLSFRSGGAPG
ncbi:hypothetical protein [Actinoplanes solisilvae]|uniref:hypothetical protein n=1 Tax=Actinoplanes solisilvae TaxID=2486853 RepID=UPI000FDB738C|nr:hypothetical protein [Actinoplanes solisilvae]